LFTPGGVEHGTRHTFAVDGDYGGPTIAVANDLLAFLNDLYGPRTSTSVVEVSVSPHSIGDNTFSEAITRNDDEFIQVAMRITSEGHTGASAVDQHLNHDGHGGQGVGANTFRVRQHVG
jgi:hypothetical protein